MESATHTMGPLYVSRHATPAHFPQFGIRPENGDGRDIATVFGPNAQADAALFGASAVMLEALEKARDYFDGYSTTETVKRYIADAIAAAKGQ